MAFYTAIKTKTGYFVYYHVDLFENVLMAFFFSSS